VLNARTQGVGVCARRLTDSNLIEGMGSSTAKDRSHDHRVATLQYSRISFGNISEGGQRLITRETGAKLDAPGAGNAQFDAPHQCTHELIGLLNGLLIGLLTEWSIGLLLQGRDDLLGTIEGLLVQPIVSGFEVARRQPFVDRSACNRGNVVPRLRRNGMLAGHPVANPLRAGIVGGRSEPKVAELASQFAQKFCRFRKRLDGVERIEQPPFLSGPRHELRNPQSTIAAACQRSDLTRTEPAFLPDHPSKEFDRKSVRPRSRLYEETDRFG
jgi:hypothetical protein